MGKKTKVVIDSNLIVSAFGWGGEPGRLLRLAVDGKIVNCTSIDLLEELSRVVAYPKMMFPESVQAEIIEIVFASSFFVSISNPIEVQGLDPSDNRILECAVYGKADYIITGDRHLLKLGSYERIPIMKAREFLDKEGFAEG